MGRKGVVLSLGSSGVGGRVGRWWWILCWNSHTRKRVDILQRVCLIFAIGHFFFLSLLDGHPWEWPALNDFHVPSCRTVSAALSRGSGNGCR